MEGISSVWNAMGAFFEALPADVVMVAVFAFVGVIILGLLGWLR